MKVESTSFIRFIYPFLFDSGEFWLRLESLNAAKWKNAAVMWQERSVPIDEVVQHVGDFLDSTDQQGCSCRRWRLASDAMQSVDGLGAHSNVEWKLLFGDQCVEFSIEVVELTLYERGVGYLTLTVRAKDDALDDWLNLLHHARFVRRKQSGRIGIQRRVGRDERSGQPRYEPYFPRVAGGIVTHAEGQGMLGEIIDSLLNSATSTSAPAQPWWQESSIHGQLLPYAAIFLRDVPTGKEPEIIYRVQNFFHARQEIHASDKDFRGETFSRIEYVDRQYFLFSIDGGAFVAFDAPRTPFFCEQLPSHLANQYYLIFDLVLYQRLFLLSISQRVSRHWVRQVKSEHRSGEATLRQIRRDFLAFTAQSYFTQAMQREHHQRCYRRWQEVFQVDRLHEGVSGEIHAVHDYLLLEKTERLEQRLNMITVVLAPPALLLAMVQVAGANSWIAACLCTIAGLAGGLWAWWHFIREH